jgi:hypothetical protein
MEWWEYSKINTAICYFEIYVINGDMLDTSYNFLSQWPRDLRRGFLAT